MKTRHLVTVLLMIVVATVSTTAQNRSNTCSDKLHSNALYVAYQPWDHGLGIRCDYHFNVYFGLYGSASYGSLGLYKGAGLKDHMKFTGGVLIPVSNYLGNDFSASIGVNRHFVSTFYVDDPMNVYDAGNITSKPWSFELGLTVKMKRFAIGVRTDILRWEPCVDVGIPLNFNQRYSCKTRKSTKRRYK